MFSGFFWEIPDEDRWMCVISGFVRSVVASTFVSFCP